MIWVMCFSLAGGFVQCSNHEYDNPDLCYQHGLYWQRALEHRMSFRFECIKRIVL